MSIVRGIDAIRLDLEMAEKEMAENDLEACRDELRRLEAENSRLLEFVNDCRSLTGSPWPQNSVSFKLAHLIDGLDYEKQETEK